MVKNSLLFIVSAICFFIFPLTFSYAAPQDETDPGEHFIRAKVLDVLSIGIQNFGQIQSFDEKMKVKLLEGKHAGTVITIDRIGDPKLSANRINVGETVVIDSKPDPSGNMTYTVYEPYRLDAFLIVFILFLLFIIAVAGKKGLGALIGMGISICVIALYIIPHILQGEDPLQTCIIGASIILIITTYIAHGISLKTTIAIIATGIALALAGIFSTMLISFLHIFGLGNEDIYNLQVGTTHPINPQGLFLGSIIIGTLGALNDITTTQAITIFTLVKENPQQHFKTLSKKGMMIGKEHIASLVNTLILAYAGSSLAVFIYFELNPAQLPWWVILNNEATMQEVIKSMVGSSALILAVPITTLLATWIALKGVNFYEFSASLGLTKKEK